MTELWTLREIEKDFLDIKPDGNFIDCINACRTNAKDQITKLCKDQGIHENWIKPGYFNEQGIFSCIYDTCTADAKDIRNNNTKLSTIMIISWIKYFFNLR